MGLLHVAVGVILDVEEQILITRRAAHSHQGGLWEFPGGKVEAGESVQSALARELREELGIETGPVTPLIQVQHDYGDKSVLLDVWLVREFSGTASACEGQPLAWVGYQELQDYSFPEANIAIVEAVKNLFES